MPLQSPVSSGRLGSESRLVSVTVSKLVPVEIVEENFRYPVNPCEESVDPNVA
jgi:hypothetical protein